MSYLTESDIIEIQGNVRLLSIHEIDNISHYSFDSHIAEYNDFLKIAIKFYNLNISKTFLLFHKKTNELLAYMTFSADSIKLKVGNLAVTTEVSADTIRKGYGSFMLEMARAFAFAMNELGIACRFITVDADIEYEPNTFEFYAKNGFIENLSNKRRNAKHTISMRRDIFADD